LKKPAVHWGLVRPCCAYGEKPLTTSGTGETSRVTWFVSLGRRWLSYGVLRTDTLHRTTQPFPNRPRVGQQTNALLHVRNLLPPVQQGVRRIRARKRWRRSFKITFIVHNPGWNCQTSVSPQRPRTRLGCLPLRWRDSRVMNSSALECSRGITFLQKSPSKRCMLSACVDKLCNSYRWGKDVSAKQPLPSVSWNWVEIHSWFQVWPVIPVEERPEARTETSPCSKASSIAARKGIVITRGTHNTRLRTGNVRLRKWRRHYVKGRLFRRLSKTLRKIGHAARGTAPAGNQREPERRFDEASVTTSRSQYYRL